MITNKDVYRCYSVNLQQFMAKNHIPYFLIAKDIQSNRTMWCYEKTDEFCKLLQQWIENNPKNNN